MATNPATTIIYSKWQRQEDVRAARVEVMHCAAALMAARLDPGTHSAIENPAVAPAQKALDGAVLKLASVLTEPAHCGECGQPLPG